MKAEFCINCEVWYDGRRYPLCCPACLQPVTERVVLWMNKSAYLVRVRERDNAGFIKQASVINGQWRLVFDSEKWEARAKATGDKYKLVTVNKWYVDHYQELAVPDDLRAEWEGDHVIEGYRSIIKWAERQK